MARKREGGERRRIGLSAKGGKEELVEKGGKGGEGPS